MRKCGVKSSWPEGKCQGKQGHDIHWFYRPDGWLIQWPSQRYQKRTRPNWGMSWTPPDHKNWVHPKDIK